MSKLPPTSHSDAPYALDEDPRNRVFQENILVWRVDWVKTQFICRSAQFRCCFPPLTAVQLRDQHRTIATVVAIAFFLAI
jgi:hypothetical protein